MDLISTAIENRKQFLTPYRKRFQNTKTKKEGVKIIAELIQLEPSHLSEPWIVKEVIAWLRDRECCDFLEDVFIKAQKRVARTEDQRKRAVRDFYVVHAINEIIAEKNISAREACRVLAIQEYEKMEKAKKSRYLARQEHEKEEHYYLLWNIADENLDLQKALRQVYNNAKKKPEKLNPPYPYYGRDIEVEENGKITIFGGR